MPALEFQSPQALWGMLAIPLLLVWAVLERRSRAVLRFSAAAMLAAQGRGVRPYLL
jgi:Ca-activated chloride channel homolog